MFGSQRLASGTARVFWRKGSLAGVLGCQRLDSGHRAGFYCVRGPLAGFLHARGWTRVQHGFYRTEDHLRGLGMPKVGFRPQRGFLSQKDHWRGFGMPKAGSQAQRGVHPASPLQFPIDASVNASPPNSQRRGSLAGVLGCQRLDSGHCAGFHCARGSLAGFLDASGWIRAPHGFYRAEDHLRGPGVPKGGSAGFFIAQKDHLRSFGMPKVGFQAQRGVHPASPPQLPASPFTRPAAPRITCWGLGMPEVGFRALRGFLSRKRITCGVFGCQRLDSCTARVL